MTARLQGDGGELDVLESWVSLEIENAEGERVTCTRSVKGAPAAKDLIDVSRTTVTSSGAAETVSSSYFVRLPGAASSPVGFHSFLASFIGWELPFVPRFDGDPGLLYMECLFPFLFVEQITGWRGITARMPTWLRIPDMWQRAIEFLLALDRGDTPLKQFLAERKRTQLLERWKAAVDGARIEVRGLGALPKDIPNEPIGTWPPATSPSLVVVSSSDWLPVSVALSNATERVQVLTAQEIPQARDVVSELSSQVAETESRLEESTRKNSELLKELEVEKEYLGSLTSRLSQLEEDLRKNQDEHTLRERGGIGDSNLGILDCPVCRRPRTDSLLAQDVDVTPMPIEANIAHIRAEIGLFEELRRDQRDVVESKVQRLTALRQETAELELQLREQRRSLRSDGELPSSAAIRERLLAEDLVRRLESAEKAFEDSLRVFKQLAAEWRENETARSSLRDTTPSTRDQTKRALIETSFKTQLQEYGFSSYGEESFGRITLDVTTFRPTKSGFDLGEMSASDTIRCVWAYLIALLECDRVAETNHPGLLILDEPRQQSAGRASFAALIRRASTARAAGQQVIFATSEESTELLDAMRETGAAVIELPSKSLQRIVEN
jgi:hypothetical protein